MACETNIICVWGHGKKEESEVRVTGYATSSSFNFSILECSGFSSVTVT